MIWELKIKVETAIVGNTFNSERGVFEFPRNDGAWGLNLSTLHDWDDLIFNAAKSLDLMHVHTAVRMPSSILLPTLHLLSRTKNPREGKRPGKKMLHEMIPRGTVLTLQFMVRDKEGGLNIKTPTHGDLYKIFSFIGNYEGISPFGGSAGYGRFRVQSLDALGRVITDLGELLGPELENTPA